ncbi:MAG: protein-L-isoaspartate(D-aspartate) O-methyltransferase [Desulfobacteraceae bacterium]|nr:protein-L-isoaspartate(D-aspartate) O-methyltransferase [Desulfobacteraceae bacterium]
MRHFAIPLILLLAWLQPPTAAAAEKMTTHAFDAARKKMVATQIRSRGVSDPAVLRAMETVPRHLFVPEKLRAHAYEDRPLPIGFGQTISQPYVVALMTQLLDLPKASRVLEVGTGSGYQAAILSHIAKEVFSVEIVKPLHARSKQTLEEAGCANVASIHRDGFFGWQEHAPYDAIIVTCAAESVPPPLVQQLKIGGVMCIPVGPPFRVQNLLRITRKAENDIKTEVITQVRFVPLTRQ